MRIAGYQPLTLIDYPGHIASTVFTQGCPFRCVYCHNPELIPTQSETDISSDEIFAQLAQDADMLDGVVVTGGEPTIHPDLPDFLGQIKALGLKVKLDTNGVNPRLIDKCLTLGVVDFIAMDIKHRWERYAEVTSLDSEVAVKNCQDTFKLIQASGLAHEFRTTVYPGLHDQEDLLMIAGYCSPGENYTLQPVRYDKTLQPDLPSDRILDLQKVKAKLEFSFPKLHLAIKE
jgi:pyruvate formate lyase activating enzyme